MILLNVSSILTLGPMVTYKKAQDYPAPHGKDLQDWFKTSSRILHLDNGELWVVTADGGAILFDTVKIT